MISIDHKNQLGKFEKAIKQAKNRYCWKCGGKLELLDLLLQFTMNEKTIKKFYILWESKYIQFYCCACFEEIESEELLINKPVFKEVLF